MEGASTPVAAVPRSDLAAAFSQAAIALSATVVRCDAARLFDTVSAYTRAESVLVTGSLRAVEPSLAALERPATGIDHTVVGLAHLGVASTGSVLISEPDAAERRAALLAIRHLVLLPEARLVPDLPAAGAHLRALLGANRYATFVSGPSRTADIEKILTLGAHGPAELVIMVVEGWNPYD